MQLPITIRFPEHLSGKLTIAYEYPADCHYKIPFASPCLTECDLGSFLSQSVNGDDYWIELWSFKIKKAGYIDIFVGKPYITIALFLKGIVSGQLSGYGFVHSPAGTYNIFYLPTGTQRMELVNGEYVLLFVIPPDYYLKSMAVEHRGIADILNRFLSSKKEGALLTNFKMPHGIWRIIKRLEKINKKGAAFDIELRRYMLEILGLYNDQFKRSDSPIPLNFTTEEKAVAARDYILANLGDINLGGLNEFALRFHITTKPLTREFKVLTNKTIPQFITDERLVWAKALLAEKKMYVFEIALIVGFSDTANFARKFKKKFGYPPGNRKNIDKDHKS